MQIAPIVDPPDLAQFFIGVGIQPGARASDGVRQQNFRI
jgi:hypothetical protein